MAKPKLVESQCPYCQGNGPDTADKTPVPPKRWSRYSLPHLSGQEGSLVLTGSAPRGLGCNEQPQGHERDA